MGNLKYATPVSTLSKELGMIITHLMVLIPSFKM